ncbi:hypothetical protein ABPG72_000852 [Tetrahymena utriculariae]
MDIEKQKNQSNQKQEDPETDVSDHENDKQQDKSQKWGEIIPLDSRKFSVFECLQNEITIGRAPNNVLRIDDKRLSGTHCKLIYDPQENEVYLQDLSTNGTFIFDKKLGKENKSKIDSGDLIYILHKSKVSQPDVIGFVVKLAQSSQNGGAQASKLKEEEAAKIKQQHKEEEEQRIQKMKEEHEEEKRKIQEQLNKFKTQDDKISEELECVICMDIIYSCVTLQPCLHNLCGACFYDWKQKSDECPNCRSKYNDFAKNPTINNLIENLLNKHPEKKNTKEYYEQMDQKIRKLWNIPAPAAPQKKPEPKAPIRNNNNRISSEDEEPEIKPAPQKPQQSAQNKNSVGGKKNNLDVCRECKKAREDDGFQCDENTKHVKCNACKKEFPDRGDESDNQKCVICDLFFCNLYMKGCKQKRYLILGNYLELLRERAPPNFIPLGFFNNNHTESKVFSQYMTQKRLTTQMIYNDILQKEMKTGKFFYEKNKKFDANETDNKRIQLRDISPVCQVCFAKVWFQMVVQYRIKVVKELPAPYNNRDKCWYGINCRTQQTKDDHAKKLDHICEQTKF